MANKIIIKNGSGAPPANALSVAELGFDTTNKKVYIGHTDGPIEMGPPDLKIDINSAISGTPNLINADTLGGHLPSHYAKATKLTPRNLLDNSDFRNPVNQRGKEIYTAAGYTIDRWTKSMGVAMTVAVGNGKITLSKSGAIGTFVQILPFDMTGKTVTFAIKTSEGITCRSVVASTSPAHTQIGSLHAYVDVYISNGTTIFRIYFSQTDDVTLGLYWAALYEGEYTAETLPEYQPKGYGAELAECQRYYRKINYQVFTGHAWSSNQMGFTIPGIAMRKMDTAHNIPSITVDAGYFFNYNASGFFASDANVSYVIESMDNTGIKVIVTDNSGRFLGNHIYLFKDAYISISADL